MSRQDKPEFSFELTSEAAHKNYLVLKNRYKLDLKAALDANSSSPLGCGSEFKDPKVLEPFFKFCPFWPRLKSILVNGSDWQLEDLDEEKRVSDLKEALAFGNHKGATNKPELLRELVNNDVTYGYALVLPLDKIQSIPLVCMAPTNVAP
jgi:hypothetical protein